MCIWAKETQKGNPFYFLFHYYTPYFLTNSSNKLQPEYSAQNCKAIKTTAVIRICGVNIFTDCLQHPKQWAANKRTNHPNRPDPQGNVFLMQS